MHSIVFVTKNVAFALSYSTSCHKMKVGVCEINFSVWTSLPSKWREGLGMGGENDDATKWKHSIC